MAFPTSVNNQITDAVTQSNVKVLGDAPAEALGDLYVAISQALSNAANNATAAQQQGSILAEAVTTACVQAILRGGLATSASASPITATPSQEQV